MLAELYDNKWVVLSEMSVTTEDIIWDEFSVCDRSKLPFIDPEACHWDGYVRFYNRAKKRIARPLLSKLKEICKTHQIPLRILDRRPPDPYPHIPVEEITEDLLPGITLEDYQVKAIRTTCRIECGIIHLPTGSGKCLGRGTPVLMYDGTIKSVELVLPGDLLMGDDGSPRTVLSTCRGYGPLYQIRQKNGNDYVVNDAHILTLYRCKSSNKHADAAGGTILDMPLQEYLVQSRWMKHILKGVKTGVEFSGNGNVPFDPYLLGVWLGDGISADLQFCLSEYSDCDIISYLHGYCRRHNYELVKYADEREDSDIYAIRLYEGVHKPAHIHHWATHPLKQLFLRYDLFRNKHIPHIFKCASRVHRLALLAGMLDADSGQGSNGYGLTIKKTRLVHDIVFLARSLGFRVSVSDVWKYNTKTGKGNWYAGINIYGHTDQIPVRVSYKRCTPRRQKKNPLVCGIEIKLLGNGDYFGFTLDGNGRFLLSDFTITHNTEVMAGICEAIPCPTVILANQKVVIDQCKQRLELREVVEEAGLFYAGKRPNGQRVVVGSIQSLIAPAKRPNPPQRTPKDSDRAWERKQEQYELRVQGWHTRQRNARMLQVIVKQAHMLIVDECDLTASKQYKSVFRFLFQGRRRYGLSGTPFDRDKPIANWEVRAHMGGVIAAESRQVIEKLGRIVKLEYVMLLVPGDPYEASAYDIAFKEHVVQSEDFWRWVVAICRKYPDDGTLILVDKTELGVNLSRELAKCGIEAPFIYGETSKKRRDEALRRFQAREVRVLIGGKIINRGLDLKSGCENLIIATGGQLRSDFTQKLGRAVRLNRCGKSRVFDCFFRGNRYLYDHSRERLRTVVEELGYKATILFPGGSIDGAELIKRRFRLPKDAAKSVPKARPRRNRQDDDTH